MPSALKLVGEPPPAPATPAAFVEAMRALASGVVLVTCWVGERPWGMTVTAFASVSADPPTLLVSLGSDSTSARAIRASRGFGVSILAAEQLAVARFGAAPGAAKFLERLAVPGGPDGGSPAVASALAHLDCTLAQAVPAADHTVFIGRVRGVRPGRPGEPLLYARRGYRTLAGPDQARHPRTERILP
jgi:flavin reductase (DIM6/NTAB) family NADH-FMN oxidoreductase RutF